MKKIFSIFEIMAVLLATLALPAVASAADVAGGFSLQVTPSPIVETIKPGQTSVVDVSVRNTGSQKEELKMGLRAFSIDDATGNVQLKDDPPKDVTDWVKFSDPDFSVESGAVFVQRVTFAVPADAGFSYSFALLISRAKPVQQAAGKTSIEGSVAIFTLLTVDRPDATRKIDVINFVSKKKVYEFLPTDFTIKLKNSGNTIVQPAGNIFIQRGNTSPSPLAVLPVNNTGAYILPGVTRTVSSSWNDGFPVYKTDAATSKKHLVWDWGQLQKLRFGHFVAKTVVIYNDGTRDIPVEASVGFWVIPWRLLGGFMLVCIFLIVGLVTFVRKTARLTRKKDVDKKA